MKKVSQTYKVIVSIILEIDGQTKHQNQKNYQLAGIIHCFQLAKHYTESIFMCVYVCVWTNQSKYVIQLGSKIDQRVKISI